MLWDWKLSPVIALFTVTLAHFKFITGPQRIFCSFRLKRFEYPQILATAHIWYYPFGIFKIDLFLQVPVFWCRGTVCTSSLREEQFFVLKFESGLTVDPPEDCSWGLITKFWSPWRYHSWTAVLTNQQTGGKKEESSVNMTLIMGLDLFRFISCCSQIVFSDLIKILIYSFRGFN